MNDELQQLKALVENYRKYINCLSEATEESDGGKLILRALERVIELVSTQEIALAKCEVFAASRQITDAYFTHPPEIKEIGMLLSTLVKDTGG